jgi:PAS domain S-box-containing protein
LSDVRDWVRTEEDLRGCCERLERLVEQRTAELRDANERFRREYERRKRIGEKLKERERVFRTLAMNVPVGVFRNDPDGSCRYVDDRACEIMGVPAEKLHGDGWTRMLHPDDRERVLAAWREMMETGKKFALEYRFLTPEGRVTWVLGWALDIRDGEGRRMGFIGSVQDIAERKKAEAILQESEERFRRLFDQSPLGKALVSADFRFLRVNEAFCRITGYSAGEMLSLDFPAITHPEDLAADQEKTGRLLAGEIDRYEMEKRYIRRDGAIIWVRLHVRGIRDEGGRFLYFLPVVEDITARKEAEAALRRLATAVEHAGEAIVVTDAAGSIDYVNPAFEQITGYGRNEAIGRNPGFLNSDLHDRSSASRMREALSRGEEWRGRFVNRKKDGTVYHEEATISPVRDASGKIVSFVAVKHDITHEVTLENQLRHFQKMEAVGQLAGGIAHDFNNILTALMGYATIMQMRMAPDEPLKLHVDQMLESVHRGAALTRSLLAFSRKQILRPRPVDLNEIVGRAGKFLARLIGEDVELRLDLSPGELIVNADSSQIEQVLLNLATNARDAMPNGGVLTFATDVLDLDGAFVRTHGYGKPGRYGIVAVSDTGMGMTEKILDKIFEPFFTTKEVGKGTGLGLSIAYGIVKQHEGYIWACSAAGKGATFRICLPAAAAGNSGVPAGGTETVLLVEDDASVREIGGRSSRASDIRSSRR